MNYFAHAWNELAESPIDGYRLAGLAVPDWLGVVARRTKCRTQHVEPYLNDTDNRVASLARGVAQHHADDAWFHQTNAFAELSLAFSRDIAEHLHEQTDLRPSFLGHILVELLLDAELIRRNPSALDSYYEMLSQIDADWVCRQIARFTGKPVEQLAEVIPRFIRIRFLADYATDRLLLFRMNQIMARVRLANLPPEFGDLLPEFRSRVAQQADALLAPSENS